MRSLRKGGQCDTPIEEKKRYGRVGTGNERN